ncbi:helix-turn-helix domain-containing protein [Pseudonocardia asaccharolytica]|uniref:Siderophore-interacting protein n=1 Tax=Pseudonocardia asaccharolytica DSM 44247 = NBRC 16224 TaxID=1123024 RepID=A0A511D720_9PSEU|nr:helix-turn-helix domain-containing protein [Pseudonocardia asaccharolytica]GEL20233.1 siderophore-interacting protein [Pseudonocardia asaccharolytica DSM 44247 = NBRC 16224]
MTWLAVEVDAARRCFLTAGQGLFVGDAVRAEVAASWERSRRHDVDPDRIAARFVGHQHDVPASVRCADAVFEEFAALHRGAGCSLVLLDASGIVRARRDCDATFARLLDGLLLVPGYGYAERVVGTTAASITLHEQRDVAIRGAEHYHSQLTCLSAAAALVSDPVDHTVCGVIAVVCHDTEHSALQLPLARMLADRLTERMAGDPHRRTQAMLQTLERQRHDGGWMMATDGDYVLSNGMARRLAAEDQRVLGDLVLAGLVLQDFSAKHVDLPSAGCGDVVIEPVHLDGEVAGAVLRGGRADSRQTVQQPEAVRRQGSHVAPLARRDYAKDLHADSARHDHAAARIRANQELLSPYLRAQQGVVASIRQGRHHLLIGEPGVGKRTLLMSTFRTAFPSGRVVTVDCASVANGPEGTAIADGGLRLPDADDGRPQLVVLHGLNALSPVSARRLDEVLRPLLSLPIPPLVAGCLDTPAVDATRPYGLLLRHFHEVTRVPALRHRIDEISEIALTIMRRLSGRRSLRLSLQVIRVLEGYAWPGNISELEDVLRYVVARKPMGEIQPPDLPQLCFQGRARRLSMLETAQCDAIIQALYEAKGNRYKAAAMLGIARSSLYRKIDAFGISYIA